MNVRPSHLRLADAPTSMTARPTWLQLAVRGVTAEEAAGIMGAKPWTAARRLEDAMAVLRSDRQNGSLRIACDAAGGDYRRVKIGDGAEDKARSYHGLAEEDIARLPSEEYAGHPYQLKINDAHLHRERFQVSTEGLLSEMIRARKSAKRAA